MSTPVRVYTVSDESRYLIVKNVPALGCIEELVKLFGTYGPIEEYRLMDEEDCEPYTDIYWIKFVKISNARFAKRKLDNFNFLGNLIEVNYAPMYETVDDTKDKLDERRSVVLSRMKSEHHGNLKQKTHHQTPAASSMTNVLQTAQMASPDSKTVDSGQHPLPQAQYFPTASMNATVQAVRHKLKQISKVGGNTSLTLPSSDSTELQQPSEHGVPVNPPGKKPRVDGRRRI